MNRLKQTAIHEAGHAVVATVLGVYFEHVSIEPDETTAGRAVIERQDATSRMILGSDRKLKTDPEEVQKDIKILYAGHEAVMRFSPNCEVESKLVASMDDEQAGELLELIGDDEQPYREQTRKLVDDNWRAVLLIANELIKWRRLDDEEVEIMIQFAQTKPSDDEIIQLVHYRVLSKRIENTDDAMRREFERLVGSLRSD